MTWSLINYAYHKASNRYSFHGERIVPTVTIEAFLDLTTSPIISQRTSRTSRLFHEISQKLVSRCYELMPYKPDIRHITSRVSIGIVHRDASGSVALASSSQESEQNLRT